MFGTGETTTITMKQTDPLSSLTPGSIKRHNGHVVPKGTRIIMMSSGAGVLAPAHEIPDSIRSPAYQSAGGARSALGMSLYQRKWQHSIRIAG
jgi:hypothetical protein